jgi:dipeptidyl-peptidase-4
MTDQQAGRPIPFEEIARLPLPGMAVPVEVAFAPGAKVLTYLYSPEGSLDRRLFAVDLTAEPPEPVEIPIGGGARDEASLSLEERLRRERARDVGLGITSAVWAEGADADALLVPLPDGVRVVRQLARSVSDPAVELVLPAGAGPEEEVVAPRLSPDGRSIAFVRGGDLHVCAAEPGAVPVRLTTTAAGGITNGVAEYVAQEEMDRGEGLWWSKDSRWIAFEEADERHIPVYRIVHQGSDEVPPSAEEDHRYPFAGQANARVRLGVVPAEGGDVTWMDLGPEVEEGEGYLARVRWLMRGRLVAELESRDQTTLTVCSFDPSTGARSVLHTERVEPWVNLHDDFRELSSGEWLWSSERSGFRHLEVRSATGELVRVLTEGEWQVDRLEAVDEDRGAVYFTGTKDAPTERHLYEVPLAGGEVRGLTRERGVHSVAVAGANGLVVDNHSSFGSPPVVRLLRASTAPDGDPPEVVATLHDRRDPRIDDLELTPPELVTLEADDGTLLYGLYYSPEPQQQRASTDGSELPPPLVVSLYGGPHAQLVVDDWSATVTLRRQALRRFGCAVLVVDNRGSARRGLRFEGVLRFRMSEVEVADQVAGVRWAVERGLADPERVGVYGWSYGGYMTLHCLVQAPEVFRAGVAGAPVTHWDGYDTHYTERYMGTPETNPTGYVSSSVFAHVEALRGDLLLVHGLIDENVHFRHTARLLNRLIAARKPYQLLCFPSERHLPRSAEDRAYLEEQVVTWLGERLTS